MPALSIMLKPAGGRCDLRCDYCFYRDEVERREDASCGVMSIPTLEAILRRTLAFAEGSCTFVFQGGEPTLAGLDFFRAAVALEKKWNVNGVRLFNAIQTNGMRVDRAWADFFKENHFLVGVSLDGDRAAHDANRRDAQGGGSFDRALACVRLLRDSQVEFNVLTVVSRQLARRAGQIYRFYADEGIEHQQYIPCLDPLGEAPGGHAYSLDAPLYARFLEELFEPWYAEARRGRLRYVRYFIGLMNLIAGNPPGVCEMNGACSRQYVVEANGDVYPCDFYALDAWRLGNLCRDSFEALEHRRASLGFIETSRALPRACRECKWLRLCRGGCRRDRPDTPDGPGQNRHCQAYRQFFERAYPRLAELVRLYGG